MLNCCPSSLPCSVMSIRALFCLQPEEEEEEGVGGAPRVIHPEISLRSRPLLRSCSLPVVFGARFDARQKGSSVVSIEDNYFGPSITNDFESSAKRQRGIRDDPVSQNFQPGNFMRTSLQFFSTPKNAVLGWHSILQLLLEGKRRRTGG